MMRDRRYCGRGEWRDSYGFDLVGKFPFTPNAIQASSKVRRTLSLPALTHHHHQHHDPTGRVRTYFGGSGVDRGTGIAIDNALNTYLAGTQTRLTCLRKGRSRPTSAGRATPLSPSWVPLPISASIRIALLQLFLRR